MQPRQKIYGFILNIPKPFRGSAFPGRLLIHVTVWSLTTTRFSGRSFNSTTFLMHMKAPFLNVDTAIPTDDQYLRLALVAGYETAVYGYSNTTTRPILFEHSTSGADVLVATNQLSNFVTGRYLPNAKWQSMWDGVFQWLAPGSDEANFGVDADSLAHLFRNRAASGKCPTHGFESRYTVVHQLSASYPRGLVRRVSGKV